MTPIEAYRHLFDSFSSYKLRCNSEWTNKDIEAFNAMDECITEWRKMQEIQDKYRWHDLRKNHDDLPEKDGMYGIAVKFDEIIETGFGQYESMYGYKPGWTAAIPSWGKIIAWREMEQFEVER